MEINDIHGLVELSVTEQAAIDGGIFPLMLTTLAMHAAHAASEFWEGVKEGFSDAIAD